MTKLSVLLALVFCLPSFSTIKAQTRLENDKVPADLLITLRNSGRSFVYTITITANGDWSYHQNYSGLPAVSLPDGLSINGKPAKKTKILKPKLSNAKLNWLIAEFEKVQFFRFGKDFPQEDKNEFLSINHQSTETISIRINGQTKEVSNYLGDFTKRTALLRDLAEKIRGAGVWNLQNGEIPDNFEVWYRITDGDKIQKDFKIKSNGEITESYHLSKFYPEVGKNLPVFIKSKIVGKLSKQQLIQLIDEFEKIGFSTFKYSPLSKYAGCSNEPILTAEKRTHINVQINHNRQMYASLYENCNPKPETDAAKFEYMANEIEKLLKTIKAIKIN